MHFLKDDSLSRLTFLSPPQPSSSPASISSTAPFSLLSVLVLSQSLLLPPCHYLSVSLPSLYSPRVEINKCRYRERERVKENGVREKEGRAERINDERSGRLSVCVCARLCVRMCLRVSDQCSIYTSQGVGGREKHRLQLQTETETGQS